MGREESFWARHHGMNTVAIIGGHSVTKPVPVFPSSLATDPCPARPTQPRGGTKRTIRFRLSADVV